MTSVIDLYEEILKRFLFSPNQIQIAVDPDAILSDPILFDKFKENNFNIIRYNHPIEFRFLYERDFRLKLQEDPQYKLLILCEQSDLLPFDIYSPANIVELSLRNLFPKLDYECLYNLPAQFYKKLFQVEAKLKHNTFGKNQSIAFILFQIYEIELGKTLNQRDFLLVLLNLHYRFPILPKMYAEYLTKVVNTNLPELNRIPIFELIDDRAYFLSYLQQEWRQYIQQQDKLYAQSKQNEGWFFELTLFNDPLIQNSISRYFVEGMLTPVDSGLVVKEKSAWYLVGLTGEDQFVLDRMRALRDTLLKILQNNESKNHQVWFKIAELFAKLKYHLLKYPHLNLESIEVLTNLISTQFEDWLEKQFDSLLSLPPVKPNILHQIPRFLARNLENNQNKKVALVVMDGMSLWQWRIISECLHEQIPDLKLTELAVFSWIPSITSISRQALFAGKAPVHFPNSVFSTNNEEKLWKSFWEEQTIQSSQIQYFRNIEEKEIFPEIYPNNQILGLVINAVDDIMHGMVLGEEGMLNQIHQWAKQPYLAGLIKRLLQERYQVWITSDHGNLETTEKITISDGLLSSSAGERVRIYNKEENIKLPSGTVLWSSVGLPDDFYPILAKENYSFSKGTGKIISHGGASIEEVIVPLIQVGKHE